ncbi:bifunctional hydroxymethylpyrimidine kinase/phosphomethylpyrimidine kinase [uncultured Cardiobacterium sp.]|uniref:bifunctional hydroxymethylpyrimidine kinase/phosphomethylpyrimidine kinase n=1 Tax=uncultured Cardiobacterium sp. TaxID=417619 RepID=UPI00262B4B56|nr:bifunctional hydroxymethylpyrimidine kinase/phosphomethylpyrimidine kinase [uncultured Cardiobacterium sp.]
MPTSIALTIAGSDSGGGAGIQADLKTFSALGVYGASVITAVTAQNTRAVTAVEAVSPALIRAQIEAVFADLPPQAVKTGMLGDSQTICTVADSLAAVALPYLVIDPVMVAKSGDKLLADAAIATLRERLIPLATLITPNLPEAGELLGRSVTTRDDMPQVAADLLALGCHAVLLKGGHLAGDASDDLLLTTGGATWLSAARHPGKNTHGTGCTLSAAITAGLARGLALVDAVHAAKDYIGAAIAAADRLHVGSGHGPLHHFHRWW